MTEQYGDITAQVRHDRGKGAARSLRREGLIPAVLYGQGKESVALALDPRLFHKATDPERDWNTFYQLTIKRDGQADVVEPCMLSEVQLHNVRRDITHLDFMRVDTEQEIVRKVSVRYLGRAAGVAAGGKLKTLRRWLRVAAKPQEIPLFVDVDVTPVQGDEVLCLRDISPPVGRFVDAPETRLVTVIAPKKTAEESTEEAAGKKKKKK